MLIHHPNTVPLAPHCNNKQTNKRALPFTPPFQADENGDGVVQYREFLPVAIEIIQMKKARELADRETARRRADAEKEAAKIARKMPRNQTEKRMELTFKHADKDGSGTLDHAEFVAVLHMLDFEPERYNDMLSRADEDHDMEVRFLG